MIKRLIAFDFDGTLANTASPEEGKPAWEKHYGKPFPHIGWWGRPESLDLDVFDVKPFPSVFNQLKREVATPDTYVIILTSRMEKLRHALQAVLDANGIVVDKLDMKHDELSKGEKILNYMNEFPDLREISVYDDREGDIESYRSIRSRMPEDISFNIYLADNGSFRLIEYESKVLKIINEEILNIFKT